MNYFYFLAIVCQLLAILLTAFARNYDSQKRELDKLIEKENAFKKVVNSIVFGANWEANMSHFYNFLLPEINEEQLKYIYEQVSSHPVRISTFDFLSMIMPKKSKYADAFYKDLLNKHQELGDIERILVYNNFQNESAVVYEEELRNYILKTDDPTKEFITWCERLTITNNNYQQNFLFNLFNDSLLIERLNKMQLTEKCKEWEKLKEEHDSYSRFEKLAPSWQGTYFASEIVK